MRNHLLRAAAGNAASGSASGHVTSGIILNLDARDGLTSGYWADQSSESHDATLVGNTSYVNDTSSLDGDYFDFDGSGDYLTFADITERNGQNLFTFEIWVNFDTITGNYGSNRKAAQLMGQHTTSLARSAELVIRTNSASSYTASQLLLGTASGGTVGSCNIDVSSLISNGTWYQIVVCKTATNAQIVYLNGSQIGTGNVSNSFTATPMAIGNNYYPSHSYSAEIDGKIGIVRMYNRALSASEVTQNWNANKDRFGYATGLITNGLTMHYDADNYSGSGTWQDESTNSNHGTLNANVTFQSSSPKRFNSTIAGKITTNATLNTSTYTKAVWFRPETNTYNNLISTNSSSGAVLWMNDSSNQITAGHSNTWNRISYTKPSNNFLNAWWYAVVTFDSSSGWVMYVNGSQVATSSNTSGFTNTNIQLLQFGNFSSNGLDGDIAMASVYDRVLTSAEVFQNWNTFKARYGY